MNTKAMRDAARSGSVTGADAAAVALASIVDGAADEIDQLRARVAELEAICREVDEWDLQWADGLDVNVERVKARVREVLNK